MRLGKTRIDEDGARQGRWFDYDLVDANTKDVVSIGLRLAITDPNLNSAYRDALKRHLSPHERLLTLYKKSSDMPESLTRKIQELDLLTFVEAAVTDWRGVEDDNGNRREYTPEGGLQLFNEYPELLERARQDARNFDNFRTQVLEDAAGN